MSYDNDEWDDDWDDDDSEPGSSYHNGPGNFGLSAPNRSHKPASSVSDVSNAGLYSPLSYQCATIVVLVLYVIR